MITYAKYLTQSVGKLLYNPTFRKEVVTGKVRRVRLLLSLLLRHPQEFCDQVAVIAERYADSLFNEHIAYETLGWIDTIECLEGKFGAFSRFLSELELKDIEDHTRHSLDGIYHNYTLPVDMRFNADILLARLCYAACRYLKPSVVVETGVAYGVTSSFILKALAKNGYGVLHSVDLPPLGRGADIFVGITIPEELKSRWELHPGVSRRVLPRLFKEIGILGMFVHDSLHTYWNMRSELEAAWTHLREGGIIIADDVRGNRAFEELKRWNPAFWGVVQDEENRAILGEIKRSGFGIALK